MERKKKTGNPSYRGKVGRDMAKARKEFKIPQTPLKLLPVSPKQKYLVLDLNP